MNNYFWFPLKKLWAALFLVLIAILALVLYRCHFNFSSGFSKDDIVSIELVRGEQRTALSEEHIGSFFNGLQKSQRIGPAKVRACFRIDIKTRNGSLIGFKTNGRIFSSIDNDYFYEFPEKQNLLPKYWDISAEEDCTNQAIK